MEEPTSTRILVVDDDPLILRALAGNLKAAGMGQVVTCQDSRELPSLLAGGDADALLLDLHMPHLSGQELLPWIRENHPELPVLIITGSSEIETAVECMKLGVSDYLVKPVEKSKLLATVGRAVENRQLRRENAALRNRLIERRLRFPEAFAHILTQDEKMQSVLVYAESVAETPHSVLISGETGTGKELVALAIHRASRRGGELVSVNVAGFDETMFADSLFGHLKGAFTGADRVRAGLVEKAAGGTLFLDEIGDLRPESQVKLLRLLESHEYYPLGSDSPRRTDARILVATNKDLGREAEEGRFRKDLYYRLRTHHVHLPPLRERPSDLPLLVEHFLAKASGELGRPAPQPPEELQALLASYPFPGNVRELRSLVIDAFSRHGSLSLRSFREAMGSFVPTPAPAPAASEDLFAHRLRLPTIKEATEALVAEALKRNAGKLSTAARVLGISPQALSQRLKRR